jgi:hypothetical protein
MIHHRQIQTHTALLVRRRPGIEPWWTTPNVVTAHVTCSRSRSPGGYSRRGAATWCSGGMAVVTAILPGTASARTAGHLDPAHDVVKEAAAGEAVPPPRPPSRQPSALDGADPQGFANHRSTRSEGALS